MSSLLIGVDASRSVVIPRTGTEAYSYYTISRLIESPRSHHFRLYFNRPPDTGELTAPCAEHVPMPFPRLWTHVRLSAEVVGRPPDVLFVPSHVLPVFRRSPSVATVHDLGYLRFPSAHPRTRWWYLHLSTMLNARASRLVIADSFATRDDLVRFYRAPASRIRVVHLGHDPRFGPQSATEVGEIRERYALGSRFLLAVGTLQPRKNLARLFDAFAAARPSLPSGMRLVVAGARGFAASDLEHRARQLGESVTFLGYVPEDDIPPLMGAADALVFPSLAEGFGLPALEAMACGTPVVCSNTSSLPEVVGDAALTVSPDDVSSIAAGLVRIVADHELRDRLRLEGPLRAARFTWENTASGVLDVLEEAAR